MKYIISTLLFLCCLNSTGQIAAPVMFSLKIFGGNGSDYAGSKFTRTPDGGFILRQSSTSTAGPILNACSSSHINTCIFQKYNADASVLEWSKCYSDSWADSGYMYMFLRPGGSKIIAGTFNSGSRWFINKEDASGNTLWSKSYGGSSSQMADGMIATDDGGYVIAGRTYSNDGDVGIHFGDPLAADIWLLKVDSNGNMLWSRVYGGADEEEIFDIVEGPDGGFYIAGRTQSVDGYCTGNKGGFSDIYVARIDRNGSMLWHRDIGGSGSDQTTNIIADGKGGLITAGHTLSSDSDVTSTTSLGCGIWLLQVDSSRNITMNKCFGGVTNFYASSICKATNGDLWMGGVSTNTGGYVETGHGRDDAFIMHTDSAGNFINAKVLGGTLWDRTSIVIPLPNAKVMAGGYCDTSNGVFASAEMNTSNPHGTDLFLAVFGPSTEGMQNITQEDTGINIFPNPASAQLNISSSEKINSVVITSLLGQIAYTGEPDNQKIQIDINELASGVYFVSVNGIVVRKFVKD